MICCSFATTCGAGTRGAKCDWGWGWGWGWEARRACQRDSRCSRRSRYSAPLARIVLVAPSSSLIPSWQSRRPHPAKSCCALRLITPDGWLLGTFGRAQGGIAALQACPGTLPAAGRTLADGCGRPPSPAPQHPCEPSAWTRVSARLGAVRGSRWLGHVQSDTETRERCHLAQQLWREGVGEETEAREHALLPLN